MALSFSTGQVAANKILHQARHACLFGGARAGKTVLIIRAIITRALKAPRSRHVILRLHQSTVWRAMAADANATIYNVARMGFENLSLNLHVKDAFFELSNGSTIWLGGLDDKERVDKILGTEFATVYLNEASEIPYATALTAITRLAQKCIQIDGEELTQRLYIDLNPVGKSHWTHRLFRQHINPDTMLPLPTPADFLSAQLNPVDNKHNLSPEFIASLAGMPAKQRKRFYEGVFVDEVEGALWTYENIDRNRRLPGDIAGINFKRVVVGVDPSGASGKDDKHSDEIGIVVAALGFDGHAYVLADRTARCGPMEWARIAVNAFHEFSADRIVAEDNFGGEMVAQTIREADRNVSVRRVRASRGKVVRAEPVSARYELNEVHHVGRFPELEDQLCSFAPDGYHGPSSPDRADALVWALTEIMGEMVLSFHVPIVASEPRWLPG